MEPNTSFNNQQLSANLPKPTFSGTIRQNTDDLRQYPNYFPQTYAAPIPYNTSLGTPSIPPYHQNFAPVCSNMNMQRHAQNGDRASVYNHHEPHPQYIYPSHSTHYGSLQPDLSQNFSIKSNHNHVLNTYGASKREKNLVNYSNIVNDSKKAKPISETFQQNNKVIISKDYDSESCSNDEDEEDADDTLESNSFSSDAEVSRNKKRKVESADDSKVTLVPGTTISLNTEEDIKKWRAERRKMWLIKISNNKKVHMERLQIKEEDLKSLENPLGQGRKDKQFIRNIQNQVCRTGPKVDLNTKLIQRRQAEENFQLLEFIEQLGEYGLLEHTLSETEKEKLFGAPDSSKNKHRMNNRNHYRNDNRKFNRGTPRVNSRDHA